MGTPLKNPPVYFTLVQVRFNAILKLTEYLPSIQDEMRKHGYPDFDAKRQVVLRITMQDGKPTPTPGPAERYFFGTVNKKHCFVLSPDFLTLQSTDYGTYENFSAKFLQGLETVHRAIKLDYTDRVGLRYLDYVAPKTGDTLAQYLAQEAQGLSVRLGGKAMHSFSETLTEFEKVKLMSRVVLQEGGLSFPPDLQPEAMAVSERFLRYSGHHAVIDTDGFIEEREMFAIDRVKQKLDSIHDVVRSAFHNTVTPYAFKVWDEND